MTVIAWDGKTLAADRMYNAGGLVCLGVKIYRLHTGELVGFSGSSAQAMEMLAWIEGGENPETFPASQRDDDLNVNVMIVRLDGSVQFYERTPYPICLLDVHTAIGSGRDFAIAAMHLGKTSEEAVAVASELSVDCGGGIDTLELEAR